VPGVCENPRSPDDSRLTNIRLFANLSKDERSTLAGLIEEYEEAEGTTLVGQGDYGYEFIVIEGGTVEVIRDGRQIDTMGPGDFFGEAASRSGALRNASIVATSAVKILALSAHNIRVVRDQMPALAEQRPPPSAGTDGPGVPRRLTPPGA
jgi:CRP-like cAMP-binding protein